MKNSLLFSSLVAAMAMTACGTAKNDKAAAPVADEKAAMASEYQALPAGAVVRVAVDADGNDKQDSAEMRFVAEDASKADDAMIARSFDNGITADKGGWNVALQSEGTLGTMNLLGNDAPAGGSYGATGYDNQGNYSTGGYTGSYESNGYYTSYRPRLFSRILRGAAWVLSRPFVWTARSYRYYYYNRPDCGCYSTQTNTTYVDVNGKTYQPQQQPTQAYVPQQQPTQTYVPQQPTQTYVPQTPTQSYVPVPTCDKDCTKVDDTKKAK